MSKEDRNTAIYVAYDDAQPFDGSVPEKNLLLAILQTALSDLRKPGDAGRRAIEYFLSPEDDYVFSFQSICDYLSIDPKRILMVTGLSSGRRPIVPEKSVTEENKEPAIEH